MRDAIDGDAAPSETGPDVWSLEGGGVARGVARFALNQEIAVVSEGNGSFSGGGLAAEIVVDLLPLYLARSQREAGEHARSPGLSALTPEHVEQAAGSVGERIRAAWEIEGFYRAMGACFACVVLRAGSAVVAHSGDCYVYRARQGSVVQLTTPHVLPQNPRLILGALGYPGSKITAAAEEALDGDRFILCSREVAPAVESALRDATDTPSLEGVVERLSATVTDTRGAACVVAVVRRTPSMNPLRRSAAWSGVAGSR